jgi:hypothetical protein
LAAFGASRWFPFVAEFPVSVQGVGTRIDLVLVNHDRPDKPRFLVVETKRANPALTYWCFAESGFGGAGRLPVIYSEILSKVDAAFRSEVKDIRGVDAIYDVAVEASTRAKGDERGSSRGAIEEAVGQVCRGLNGLIEYFRPHGQVVERTLEFFPMVVTTAELLTTTKTLRESDLETGRITLGREVQSRPWVFYRYPQSPGLKHSIPANSAKPLDLPKALKVVFSRIVAIVQADKVEAFLRRDWWD